MKKILLTTVLFMGLYTGSALSQPVSVVGLPIKFDDSIEVVKTTLRTTMEPEEATSAGQRNTKQLRLKTKGIWVFFDKTGHVMNIRLDAPFAGNIGGVRIGDSIVLLEKTLGKPAKLLKMGIQLPDRNDPYLYYIGDITTARFDFDRDGQIETIFLFK